MGSDTLRMPTVAVTVELAIGPSQETARGELFVIDSRQHANLVDAVALLLENTAQFVPFREEGGVVRLVAKSAIVTVTIPGAPHRPDPDADLELYDRQHRVEVLLLHGTRFAGLLLDNSPADHPRTIDHLNSMARHVRLWTAESHVLIAKAQIASVTELAEAE